MKEISIKHKPSLRCRISAKLMSYSPGALMYHCTLGRRKRPPRLCHNCECNIDLMIQEGFEEGFNSAEKIHFPFDTNIT